MDIYAHVLPTAQKEAAAKMASLSRDKSSKRESIKQGASVDDLWALRGIERAAESKQHE